MDVNKTEPAQSMTGSGGRKQQRRPGEPPHEAETEDENQGWTDAEAVELDGVASDMTPAAQAAFDTLAAELEPLRRRVAAADARIEELRQAAGRHAFLDLANRREFLRELGYVIGHAGDMTPPPALVLAHVEQAERYRLAAGRAALDALLARVHAAIAAAIGPSDAIGSIGGSDFGVILLLSSGETASARVESIGEAVTAVLPGGVSIRLAAHELARHLSPEAALEAADRALRAAG